MHVLLVEDDRTISAYVKQGLEEKGYAVDMAYTGAEAQDWVKGGTFDLMILDLMLPDPMDVTICRELRREGGQRRF